MEISRILWLACAVTQALGLDSDEAMKLQKWLCTQTGHVSMSEAMEQGREIRERGKSNE